MKWAHAQTSEADREREREPACVHETDRYRSEENLKKKQSAMKGDLNKSTQLKHIKWIQQINTSYGCTAPHRTVFSLVSHRERASEKARQWLSEWMSVSESRQGGEWHNFNFKKTNPNDAEATEF